jgi:hypothetical protein
MVAPGQLKTLLVPGLQFAKPRQNAANHMTINPIPPENAPNVWDVAEVQHHLTIWRQQLKQQAECHQHPMLQLPTKA